MNHAINFDTLQYVKKMKSAGMDEKLAEAQAEALADIIELASQRDESHLSTSHDVMTAKSELELKIAELRAEIIKWMIGISTANAAFIISVVKYLH